MAKNEQPAFLHVVYGDDEYAVKQQCDALVDSLVPENSRDTGLEVIDAQCSTIDETSAALGACFEALQTGGFFSSEKLVWLRGVTFLVRDQLGSSPAVKDLVAKLCELIGAGFPAGTVLLVSASGVDKRTEFYKTCSAAGRMVECAMPKAGHKAEAHAMATAKAAFAERGVKIDGPVLQSFVARAGTDSRQVVMEAEKVCLYLGGAAVATDEAVREVVSATRESLMWDLPDAFGERDLAKALTVLRRLVAQKVQAIGLIRMLENRIRELLVYRRALYKGWLKGGAGWGAVPSDVEQIFSEMFAKDPRAVHPFRVGILAKQARKYSRAELLRGQELLLEAHEKLVGSPVSRELIMELLLVKLMKKAS